MEDEQERREEGQEEEVRQKGQEEEVGQEGQEEQVGQEGQEEGEEVGELSVKLTAPRDGCLWPMYHTAIRKLKKNSFNNHPIHEDYRGRRGPAVREPQNKQGRGMATGKSRNAFLTETF